MNLKELDVSNNEIERIENLGGLKQLRVLKLNGNRIRKIENISVLKNLEVLELACNFIEEIPSLISLNKLLSCVNLSQNCIQKKENILNLRPCKKLREVYLTGNPFAESAEYLSYVQGTLRQLNALDGQCVVSSSAFKRGVSTKLDSKTSEAKRNRYNQTPDLRIDVEEFEESLSKNGEDNKRMSNYYSSDATKTNYIKKKQMVYETSNDESPRGPKLLKSELNEDVMTDEQFSGRYIFQIPQRDSRLENSSQNLQSSTSRSCLKEGVKERGHLDILKNLSQRTSPINYKKREFKSVENGGVESSRAAFQQQKQTTSLQSYRSLKKVLDSGEFQNSKEKAIKVDGVRLEKQEVKPAYSNSVQQERRGNKSHTDSIN